MSILEGAVGAGAILALLAHESTLAREADKLNAHRAAGEAAARERERSSRARNLGRMRSITDARMRTQMMGMGIVPTVGGDAAMATYMQEMARRGFNPRTF